MLTIASSILSTICQWTTPSTVITKYPLTVITPINPNDKKKKQSRRRVSIIFIILYSLHKTSFPYHRYFLLNACSRFRISIANSDRKNNV